MTDADYNDIASKTENYSGADLSILCKDAAMVPLRFAQKATKWQKVNENGKTLYMAADNNAMGHDIVQMGLYDLPDNGLKLPDMNHSHFIAALKTSKPTVCTDDLGEFVQWTNEFGEMGA